MSNPPYPTVERGCIVSYVEHGQVSVAVVIGVHPRWLDLAVLSLDGVRIERDVPQGAEPRGWHWTGFVAPRIVEWEAVTIAAPA